MGHLFMKKTKKKIIYIDRTKQMSYLEDHKRGHLFIHEKNISKIIFLYFKSNRI